MSSPAPIATGTFAWKVRHSAWLLAVVLGVGSFSCLGFVYCALRVGSTAWKRRAVVTSALSGVGVVLLLTPLGPLAQIGAAWAAVLWLVLIGYGLVVNHDYLRWRAAQEPTPVAWEPTASVDQRVPVAPAAVPSPPPPTPPSSPPPPPPPPPPAPNAVPEQPLAPATAIPAAVGLPRPADTLDEPEQAGPAVSSWQQAEALAAWHMQRLGFEDAAMTPPGADGGLDVRATDAVAQVKHYSSPVGAPAVQQLRGAAHGLGAALFYSLAGYTKAAVTYANDAAVALFSYDVNGVVQPVNHAARILHDRAGGDDAFDAADFETQAEIVALLHQYFEVMNAKYVEVAERAVAAADGDRSSPILTSVTAENARVGAILQSLQREDGRVSSDRLIEASSAIGEAAMRLAADLRRM